MPIKGLITARAVSLKHIPTEKCLSSLSLSPFKLMDCGSSHLNTLSSHLAMILNSIEDCMMPRYLPQELSCVGLP